MTTHVNTKEKAHKLFEFIEYYEVCNRVQTVSDMKVLTKRITGNLLPYSLLRQMVLDYLYMFPTTEKDKQRICSMLGIPVATQRLIGMRSTQQKRQ